MNASQLLLPDGKPSGVWMCERCHRIGAWNGTPALLPAPTMPWKDEAHILAQHSEDMRQEAERCCRPPVCKRCSQPTGRNWSAVCEPCHQILDREKEAKRFEAAQKLTADEWVKSHAAEMLYDERHDKWFNDLEDAEEWFADDEERERPAYLWCTSPVTWRPDASGDIADGMRSEFDEDASDRVPANEWKRLDEMVNKWWEEQAVRSFTPDFSRCVLLPPVEQKGAVQS